MNQQTVSDGYFQFGQLTLHYLNWGNEGASPLVLLHHLRSQSHTWDAFARRMSTDYRVVALDMRGHSDSPGRRTYHCPRQSRRVQRHDPRLLENAQPLRCNWSWP